ncbi:hypothetical protein BJ508DRAFT_305134 [Ascobolus immersus RN42]|uniref:Uncharacterized protein n=1 Tax=Ascobolus immersus RN42 TaxID=1160509 RepID=A0A3N4IBI8_ASCIM|nr:hypothetical protein BJ508DRAFT_305134 [Ascobolus immersus RN42]
MSNNRRAYKVPSVELLCRCWILDGRIETCAIVSTIQTGFLERTLVRPAPEGSGYPVSFALWYTSVVPAGQKLYRVIGKLNEDSDYTYEVAHDGERSDLPPHDGSQNIISHITQRRKVGHHEQKISSHSGYLMAAGCQKVRARELETEIYNPLNKRINEVFFHAERDASSLYEDVHKQLAEDRCLMLERDVAFLTSYLNECRA